MNQIINKKIAIAKVVHQIVGHVQQILIVVKFQEIHFIVLMVHVHVQELAVFA